jgi:hypothetical protein
MIRTLGIRILELAIVLSATTSATAQTSGTWEVVGPSGCSDGGMLCCQIAFDSHNVPYVAYQDLTAPFAEASVKSFDGVAWRYVGPKGGASIGRGWYNQMAFDAFDNLFVASRDYGVAGKLNVRMWDPTAQGWINIGPYGTSPGEAHYTVVRIDQTNAPVVVYADRTTSPVDQATAMRFDYASGSWATLGGNGVSSNGSSYDAIAIDSHDVMYIAFADAGYPDGTNVGKASVMRYDRTSSAWRFIGPPGFTNIGTPNLWIQLDRYDVPYLVYQLYHTALIVLRWDGSTWVQVGGSASGSDHPDVETEPWRQWLSLRFDSQNTPYVAYQLLDNGWRAAVRKFDGTNWVPVGNIGFSAGPADYLAMQLDQDDVPWVVFRDGANGQRMTVMRYKPAAYTYCTPSTSSLGCAAPITTFGLPSATSGSPFTISTSQVLNHHLGMLLYGLHPDHIPFGAGALCIHPPMWRVGAQSSGGNAGVNDCSGVLAYNFNPLIQSHANPSLAIGQAVFAQYWYRDTLNPNGPSLSDAVRFFIGP